MTSDPRVASPADAPTHTALIGEDYSKRGFLPLSDPLTAFPPDSKFAVLDEIGRDLPSRLMDRDFRRYARDLDIPTWPAQRATAGDLPALRLYYLRVGFLASAYINQIGQTLATVLPRSIAVPLCHVCKLLQHPPILSYAGYALYNWKRFDKQLPIALGNIDTLQNFVHHYDEHWFILVHVEIEAIAVRILAAIAQVQDALPEQNEEEINHALIAIETAIQEQIRVLHRIPEHMDSALYYKSFRPYIRFFENVMYEGVTHAPINFRGETGAQSSIMPLLVAFMKIRHRPSILTDHLADMRRYMPPHHRHLIERVEAMPEIRAMANQQTYNGVLEAMASFREVHYNWAQEYINRWTDDPRGTGGTPYIKWLKQLIDETRASKTTKRHAQADS